MGIVLESVCRYCIEASRNPILNPIKPLMCELTEESMNLYDTCPRWEQGWDKLDGSMMKAVER